MSLEWPPSRTAVCPLRFDRRSAKEHSVLALFFKGQSIWRGRLVRTGKARRFQPELPPKQGAFPWASLPLFAVSPTIGSLRSDTSIFGMGSETASGYAYGDPAGGGGRWSRVVDARNWKIEE
jgi:hypothetical protein